MKEKVYLRIGKSKNGYVYKVDKKRNNKPFDNGYYSKKYFPTIIVALNIEVPEEMFERAQAELNLKVENLEVASEIEINQEIIDEE